jgi:hypothetical protein
MSTGNTYTLLDISEYVNIGDSGKSQSLRERRAFLRDAPYPKFSHGTEDVVYVKYLQIDTCVRSSDVFAVFAADLGRKSFTGTDLLQALKIDTGSAEINAFAIFAQLDSLIRSVCDAENQGLDGVYSLKQKYMAANQEAKDPKEFADNCRILQLGERPVVIAQVMYLCVWL